VTRYAEPAAIAHDPHVGVAQIRFRALSVADPYHAKRKPDDRGVTVLSHRKVVGHSRFDPTIERCGERELLRFVAPAAIVVGRHEIVGKDRLDEVGVLLIERRVPPPLQIDEYFLIRLCETPLRGRSRAVPSSASRRVLRLQRVEPFDALDTVWPSS